VKHLSLDNSYTELPERLWDGKSSATMLWHDINIQPENVCEKAFVEPKRFRDTSAQYSIITAGLLGQRTVYPAQSYFCCMQKSVKMKSVFRLEIQNL